MQKWEKDGNLYTHQNQLNTEQTISQFFTKIFKINNTHMKECSGSLAISYTDKTHTEIPSNFCEIALLLKTLGMYPILLLVGM